MICDPAWAWEVAPALVKTSIRRKQTSMQPGSGCCRHRSRRRPAAAAPAAVAAAPSSLCPARLRFLAALRASLPFIAGHRAHTELVSIHHVCPACVACGAGVAAAAARCVPMCSSMGACTPAKITLSTSLDLPALVCKRLAPSNLLKGMAGLLQALAGFLGFLLGCELAPGTPEHREAFFRSRKERNNELAKPASQRNEERLLELTKCVLQLRIEDWQV